jgi:dynein heavy chain
LEESQSSLHHVIQQAAANIQEMGFQLIEFLSSFPAQVSVLKVLSTFFFYKVVI